MKNKLLGHLKKNEWFLALYKGFFFIMSWMPKKKNLIMFESFNGRQYSDSPRAIYEYLLKKERSYEMVWCVDRRFVHQFQDKGVPFVTRFSWQWLRLMPRAGYWVTNSRLPYWLPKPKGTVYVQTWHGTPLKKLGIDIEQIYMAEEETETYKQDFLKEAKKWDYLVSPNVYSTAIFRRAFGYSGTMLETGYPRNDILTHQNEEESIRVLKKKNGWPMDKKIVLYAPTWRDDTYYEKGRYKFDIPLDLKKMKETLGDDYLVLLRFHYLVAEQVDVTAYDGFVEDVSGYEDIRDLYLVSDVLITDYSSVFFDYSILKRPILFFVDDMEHYRDNLRGFYFDFEKEAPGLLLRTTESVVNALEDIRRNDGRISEEVKLFGYRFNNWEDGKATERVVKTIWGTK